MLNERKQFYAISLLMSTDKKMTCESLAKKMRKGGDFMLEQLKNPPAKTEELINCVKLLFKLKRLYLVINDTLLEKRYSQLIEGSSDNYDSSNRICYRSICTVVAMLTDGKNALPIDHRIWTSPEVKGSIMPKKTDLARELIDAIGKFISIEIVILDGLYATIDLQKWLIKSNIKYEMRFHANRVAENKVKIKNLVIIKKKKLRRTIKVVWHGLDIYVTAVKRCDKKGKYTIVYQVSNYKASAFFHEQIYSYRWNIEKFFRTAKQQLGLGDCQCRKLERQVNHIKHVFVAYIIAAIESKKFHYKSIEDALRAIKRKLEIYRYSNIGAAIRSFT